jgi:hypothetical protein
MVEKNKVTSPVTKMENIILAFMLIVEKFGLRIVQESHPPVMMRRATAVQNEAAFVEIFPPPRGV